MQEFCVKIELEMIKESNSKQKSEAGRLGGRARIVKYGNPGTAEGRKLGGQNAARLLRKAHTAFKTERKITHPEKK